MKRILFLLTLMGFLSVNVFGQAIPKQINYQGILKEGSALLDGNYPFTFRIYNDPTGGSALWTESQTITVENGLFSAHLGSVTPIAGVPFNRVHFLGITIGTGSELAPRTMLTPSAYSFMSMDIMDNTVSTLKLQDAAVTSSKIGSNQVVKSVNGLKDDVTFVAGTNITLTPSGNNITINAAGGGGGSVTQVNTGPGLTGGPITTTGTISVPNDGITNAMLQGNSVTSAKILDGTITGADIANSTIGAEKLSFTPGTGTVTNVATGSGLTGGPITTTGTISIPNDGITSAMLQGNSVTSAKISDGTITAADIGATQVVKALNNLKDNVTLVAGTNVTITPSGNNLTIAATSTGVGGSGTTNYLPRFTATTTLGSSAIFQSGANLGIGTTSPTSPLHLDVNNSTAAIYSVNNATGVSSAGVYGEAKQLDYYGYGGNFIGGWMGVRGVVTPSGGNSYYGIYGSVSGGTSPAGNRYGVYGTASGTGTGNRYGVYGSASGGAINYAGYFVGGVTVTGTLSKGGGSFKIDHPLDPANKYLYHSFVESPDMMNIYNGNVVTDGSGYAAVSLPDWFEALNKDFRYQLTVIGDFAQAIIAQEVQGNQFGIRTDKPNIKVSWQVTGIRKDAFAEKYRIPVEEIKKDDEIGKYIHPDVFGMPEYEHRL
jgi:trimeric autotransporter adhesin